MKNDKWKMMADFYGQKMFLILENRKNVCLGTETRESISVHESSG